MPTQEPSISLVSKDARGEIYSISLPGDRELMLLHSKKGTLRGGHSHNCPESVMVLTGMMRYHKHGGSDSEGLERQFLMGDGDHEFHMAGTPHMGEFLEDTWLIEWKICKDRNSWKNTNYEPWRAKVKANAGT